MIEFIVEAAGFNYRLAVLWFQQQLTGEWIMQVAFKTHTLEIKTLSFRRTAD